MMMPGKAQSDDAGLTKALLTVRDSTSWAALPPGPGEDACTSSKAPYLNSFSTDACAHRVKKIISRPQFCRSNQDGSEHPHAGRACCGRPLSRR